jgi:hypothetical protein
MNILFTASMTSELEISTILEWYIHKVVQTVQTAQTVQTKQASRSDQRGLDRQH